MKIYLYLLFVLILNFSHEQCFSTGNQMCFSKEPLKYGCQWKEIDAGMFMCMPIKISCDFDDNNDDCLKFELKDKDKKCFFYNGKCIEVEVYQDCYLYISESLCFKIQANESFTCEVKIDPEVGKTVCYLRELKCNDFYSSEEQCQKLVLLNGNKCSYDNSKEDGQQCYEVTIGSGCQYDNIEKKCILSSSENPNATICELSKNEEKVSCTKRNVQCIDFDDSQEKCLNAELQDTERKCIYNSELTKGQRCFEISAILTTIITTIPTTIITTILKTIPKTIITTIPKTITSTTIPKILTTITSITLPTTTTIPKILTTKTSITLSTTIATTTITTTSTTTTTILKIKLTTTTIPTTITLPTTLIATYNRVYFSKKVEDNISTIIVTITIVTIVAIAAIIGLMLYLNRIKMNSIYNVESISSGKIKLNSVHDLKHI